jgi:excisionase family DNA binding protein
MQKESAVPKLLYSFEEAASALSLSPWTLRVYAKRGILPTVKIGTRRLIRVADLDRIVAEGLDSLTSLPEAA